MELADEDTRRRLMDDAIQKIRKNFTDTLDMRILQFEAVTRELSLDGDHEKALSGISHLAHKISGIAETIGYPVIGRQSQQIEEMVQRQRGNVCAASVWCTVEPHLKAYLDNLEQMLEAD